MGIQCSALYRDNTFEAVMCAHKAIFYPSFLLYDLKEKKVTKKFEKALNRIFRIIDKDNDNLLKVPWILKKVDEFAEF